MQQPTTPLAAHTTLPPTIKIAGHIEIANISSKTTYQSGAILMPSLVTTVQKASGYNISTSQCSIAKHDKKLNTLKIKPPNDDEWISPIVQLDIELNSRINLKALILDVQNDFILIDIVNLRSLATILNEMPENCPNIKLHIIVWGFE